VIRSGVKLGIAAAIVLVLAVALGAAGFLPSLSNPFATEREQRDSPAILQALEDVSDYTAATANLQTSFEVEDESVLPDFLLGETISFEAYGSVDGVVDFSALTADAIVVDDKAVTITLPQPTLANVRVDPDESRVVDVDRGVLDRFADLVTDDAVNESDLYAVAEERLLESAAQTELIERARENTDVFLTTLLSELGFEEVTVVFETPDDPRS
jgi:Protein of unknown function (DUF4230)